MQNPRRSRQPENRIKINNKYKPKQLKLTIAILLITSININDAEYIDAPQNTSIDNVKHE